ncbi:ELWxxDGT repeat protein [Chryseosolibacter indicus]|uniref:T9SS type A sorting domain-containing protein n=1 Tax=Chryseosolibacter indicus TaxID=2782351 RepID=A0ABS5VSK6_9BACT|nr:ELWxxDGT repeat protein [Chryseosolibacter indicus]MBT1704412.1 T9SS type A sorting domain-containing protein [Chryseosolibacter indicus]
MRKKLLSLNFNVASPLKGFARVTVLSIILISFLSADVIAQAKLLKNLGVFEEPYYNEYSEIIKTNNLFYFISHNELWKSDGTTANTQALKKFNSIAKLTAVGNRVYFIADDGSSGTELWRSDGTPSSTVRIRDIVPGAGSSSPYNLTAADGILFFVANNNVNGNELWKSNGTAAGTVLVKDILKVSGSSKPENLTNVNGTIYFSASDGQNGYELWKSNGTAAGTVMVKDIRTGHKVSSSPHNFVNVNGTLFFAATDNSSGSELWKSNGTAAGTVRVKDIRSGATSSGIRNTTDVNGTLFFTASDGITGEELWKSDGTDQGTVLVKDMNPGRGGSNSTDPFNLPMGKFKNINGILYFIASKGNTDYIYRSDGTEAGTFPITIARGANINPPDPDFTYLNGKVYFMNQMSNDYHDFYLMSMDYNGTTPIRIKRFLLSDDYYTNYHQEMIAFNNSLYTYGRLYDEESGEENVYKLIKSDGTSEGTVILKDAFVSTFGSDPREMVSLSNKYVFIKGAGYMSDVKHIWATDGTTAGTRELAQTDYEHEWAIVGDLLYYTALGFVNGHWSWQLWKTKGTQATTKVVIDDNGGIVLNFPRDMTAVGNALFYHDNEGGIWKSEAQGEGHITGRLRKFDQVHDINNAGGTAFLIVTNAGRLELWKTTPTTVVKVKTLPGSVRAGVIPATSIGNISYFTLSNPSIGGDEVWRSDGTASGTFKMTNLSEGELGVLDVHKMGSYQGQLYVGSGNNMGTGTLYKATGSATLERFYNFNGKPDLMVEHNGRLIVFPFANEYNNYHEVWSTDGTENGTVQMNLMYLNFGQFWETPIAYAIIGDAMFFGSEYSSSLWKTDGICAEPVPTGKVVAFGMAPLGNHLIFGSRDNYTGYEPYIYENIPTSSPCTETLALMDVTLQQEATTSPIFTPYPNPFTNQFTLRIEGKDDEVAEIQVYSATGLPVDQLKDIRTNTEYTDIGANWPKGMYIVKINKGGTISSHTIVKK